MTPTSSEQAMAVIPACHGEMILDFSFTWEGQLKSWSQVPVIGYRINDNKARPMTVSGVVCIDAKLTCADAVRQKRIVNAIVLYDPRRCGVWTGDIWRDFDLTTMEKDADFEFGLSDILSWAKGRVALRALRDHKGQAEQ